MFRRRFRGVGPAEKARSAAERAKRGGGGSCGFHVTANREPVRTPSCAHGLDSQKQVSVQTLRARVCAVRVRVRVCLSVCVLMRLRRLCVVSPKHGSVIVAGAAESQVRDQGDEGRQGANGLKTSDNSRLWRDVFFQEPTTFRNECSKTIDCQVPRFGQGTPRNLETCNKKIASVCTCVTTEICWGSRDDSGPSGLPCTWLCFTWLVCQSRIKNLAEENIPAKHGISTRSPSGDRSSRGSQSAPLPERRGCSPLMVLVIW